MSERIAFDAEAYERRVRQGPCFICALASGDAEYRRTNVMIHEDPDVLVFLNRYPTLLGYTLVCPRRTGIVDATIDAAAAVLDKVAEDVAANRADLAVEVDSDLQSCSAHSSAGRAGSSRCASRIWPSRVRPSRMRV